MTDSDRSKLHTDLLRWYEQNKRDLPWRRTSDPYRIWLSEVLLQQTRVETARVYYERFLERFPALDRLARSSLEDVLVIWQGLGYYGRARNLHRAARHVTGRLQGRIPEEPEGLLQLPGVGPYTARAIASIAFGKDTAVLDGNVMRVLCRVFRLEEDPRNPAARMRLQGRADRLLPAGKASIFNQAMMELGALVCKPVRPLCSHCPLSSICRAFQKNQAQAYPRRSPRRPQAIRLRVVAAVLYRGRLLFTRRPPQGLLGGLWELPGLTVDGRNSVGGFAKLRGKLKGIVSLESPAKREMFSVYHAYTHFQERLQVVACRGRPVVRPSALQRSEPFFRWIHPMHLDRYAVTGATRKILERLP